MSTTVTVVAVGDGACSVLTSRDSSNVKEVAVIDCGVRQGSPKAAGRQLKDVVAAHPEKVREIVVSHFDVDHWWGLRHFAEDPAVRATIPGLTLYYPAMPPEVPAGVMSFMTAGPHGVAPVDLRERLNVALRPGTRVKARALSRGDMITLAGERFDVLWPPAGLTVGDHPALAQAVGDVRLLAADLAAQGLPEMEQNLEATMQQYNEFRDIEDSEPEPDRVERDADMARPEAFDGLIGWQERNEAPEEDRPGLVSVPPEMKERFNKVYKRIRNANNAMSLILAARNGLLVCYGDATDDGQIQAATDLAGRTFAVSLAPHHGTWKMPVAMPYAHWCISQAGAPHLLNWKLHRESASHSAKCLNTALAGTVSFASHDPWWPSRAWTGMP